MAAQGSKDCTEQFFTSFHFFLFSLKAKILLLLGDPSCRIDSYESCLLWKYDSVFGGKYFYLEQSGLVPKISKECTPNHFKHMFSFFTQFNKGQTFTSIGRFLSPN